MTSNRDDWTTPCDLFVRLNSIFNFDLDAASDDINALCVRHYTAKDDSPAQRWTGSVWLNPPYGRGIGAWISKARTESERGASVVVLVPVRTDARWFADMWHASALVFVRGRLKFGGGKTCAPFPSVIAIFGRALTDAERDALGEIGRVILP
jgi:phage N-6-adenine-methyltransferase